MPDPKLQVAIDEFWARAKRDHIAGILMVASPTHGSVTWNMPPWTYVTVDEKRSWRFECKPSDFPSPLAREEAIMTALSAIAELVHFSREFSDNMKKLLVEFSEREGISLDHFSQDEPLEEP